jgi:shikimate kinase
MLENWILYLVGPPGVGKLTVAKHLCRDLACRLIDNHYWLNPIFRLIEQDGVTPLPAGVWPLTEYVRQAVFETIATHSPATWNFVFTHAAVGGPEFEEADRSMSDAIAAIVSRRGASALAVRLTCAPEELAHRVMQPERRALMKECDENAARENARRPPFDPGWRQILTIDTTSLSSEKTAERIIAHAEAIERQQSP